MAAAERKSDTKLTTDTPYLALTAELCVSFAKIREKIDRVITAPQCTWKKKVTFSQFLQLTAQILNF